MADGHRVRAGVGDEQDPCARFLDLPDRQIHLAAHARRARPGSPPHRCGSGPTNSAHRLAAVEPRPAFLGRPAAQFGVGVGRLLRGRAVPFRVADLLQPRVDLLVAPEPGEQRRGRLAGRARAATRAPRRRPPWSSTWASCSAWALAPFGERWIDDVQSVAHPFRLAVAHEHDLHAPDRRDRRPTPTRTVRQSLRPVACPHVRTGVPARLVPGSDATVRVPLPQRARCGPATCRRTASATSIRSESIPDRLESQNLLPAHRDRGSPSPR